MLDFRYHVFSLVAVFLALGLGMLIGSGFGNSAITTQQNHLLQTSIKKLDTVLQERTEDRALLGQDREALRILVPHLTHNSLTGRHVAIVRAGDYPEAVQDAQEAIEQAGGTVTSVTVLSDRFALLSDKERAVLQAKLLTTTATPAPTQTPHRSNHDATASPDDAPFLLPLARALRQGVQANSSLQGDLDELNRAQLISHSGDYDASADSVVIVGGESSPPIILGQEGTDLESQFIQALRLDGTGTTIVGCETEAAVASSVPSYQEAGIASCDCIDEPLGALDLVYALQGAAASYGVKTTADHLVPASLEASIPATP